MFTVKICFGNVWYSDVLSSKELVKSVDMIANEEDLLIVLSVSSKTDIAKQAFALKESHHCQIALVTMNNCHHIKI